MSDVIITHVNDNGDEETEVLRTPRVRWCTLPVGLDGQVIMNVDGKFQWVSPHDWKLLDNFTVRCDRCGLKSRDEFIGKCDGPKP